MPRVRLLPGESQQASLRPHPLSFLGRYVVATLPALWGIALWAMFHSDSWASSGDAPWWQVWKVLWGTSGAAATYAVLGLAVLGAIVAVAGIRWARFFMYLAVGALAVVATAIGGWGEYAWSIPLVLWATGPLGIVWVEMDRLSHRYVVTNLRILFHGGVLVRRERQLRFESVTDLAAEQSILGRILGYGTIIPVTQSGFGLGADSSQAMIAGGAGGKPGPVGVGLGVAAGGGKEVQTARARSFHQLTGIKPFRATKHMLEALIQNATMTPYLRQQVALQKQMVHALRQRT